MGAIIANREAEEFWSARASNWLEDQEALEIFGGAPGEAAIERLAPQPGERILDIGCGGGATTVSLARRVAPGGSVLGVDIAAAMVAGAQRRAAAAGCEGASFAVADAQVEDFGTQAFDAAFSRFGVMFFADPVAAFANIRRCLVPGGRLSFCCWQDPLANEWMLIPTMVVLGILGQAPPQQGPGDPGPYSLADPERVRQILEAAGFRGVDIARCNDTVEISEAEVATRTDIALRQGLLAELLREASEETRQQAATALRDALHSRMEGGIARQKRGYLVVGARA